MNFGFSRRGDRLLAALLLLAFALAAWHISQKPRAAKFAWTEPQSVTPSSTPGKLAVATVAAGVGAPLKFKADFVSSSPGQAVHAASLVELKNGDLRAVWFSGSREGGSDVTIQTALLDRATQRWGAEQTLFDRRKIQHGLVRYVKKIGNPVIARAPDGSLLLWMVNVSLGGWAGSAISWSRSMDEGKSWSQPRRLVTSPLLNISTLVKGGPVALSDGQMVLPVYHEFATKFGEVLRLDAQGQLVDKVRIPGSHTSLQPVMLVSGAGQARIFMRSGDSPTVNTSVTGDSGMSWSKTQATSLPNPDSALAGLVTLAGEHWLALNPSTSGRETLSLVKARKDGDFANPSMFAVEAPASLGSVAAAVDYEKILENELRASGATDEQVEAYVASAKRQLCNAEKCAQEFSYPFLLQSRDGYIHLVYTWHRTRIKHVRFDPVGMLP